MSDNHSCEQEAINKKYKFDTMSPEFLASDSWTYILDGLLGRIENINPLQSQIDTLYDDMLSKIFSEMDEYIEYKCVSKKRANDLKFTNLFGMIT